MKTYHTGMSEASILQTEWRQMNRVMMIDPSQTENDQTSSRRWKLLISILISLLALWFALRIIDAKTVMRALVSIDIGWLLLGIITQIVALMTRAIRWGALLGPHFEPGLAFHTMNIGYLVNTLLPFRLGELVRPLLLSVRSDRKFYHAAATVLVERLLDILIVTLVMLLTFTGMEVPVGIRKTAGIASLMVLILSLLLFLAIRHRAWLLDRGGSTLIPISEKAYRWFENTLNQIAIGFDATSTPRQIGKILSWSLLSWGLSIALNYCVMRAFTSNVRLIEAAFLIVPLTFSMTVPSSPGYLGVFELVGQQALVVPFGARYTPSLAFTITLFIHTIFLAVTSIFGAVGLISMKLSLRDLQSLISEKPHMDRG